MSRMIFALSFCVYVVYHFDNRTLPCLLNRSMNFTACTRTTQLVG